MTVRATLGTTVISYLCSYVPVFANVSTRGSLFFVYKLCQTVQYSHQPTTCLVTCSLHFAVTKRGFTPSMPSQCVQLHVPGRAQVSHGNVLFNSPLLTGSYLSKLTENDVHYHREDLRRPTARHSHSSRQICPYLEPGYLAIYFARTC